MKKILFLLILVSKITFSNELLGLKKNKLGEKYVEYYNDDFILRLGILSQNLDISLGANNSDELLIYKPNTKKLLSTKFTFKNLSLTYVFDPGFSNEKKDMIPSSYQDLTLISDFGNHALEFNFQRYKGFYSEKFPDFDESLESNKYTLNYYFKLSKKFSFDAVFNLNEKQIKSYGTFMLVLSPEWYRINNDLVYHKPGTIKAGDTINSVDFYSLALGPSFAYTFSKKDFYLSLVYFYGLGPQRGEYVYNNIDYESSDMISKSNLKIGFGYNSRRFFTGAYYNSTKTDYPVDFLNMGTKNSTFEVFFGGRI